MKTNIKSCSHEGTDYHDEKMPKLGFSYIYVMVILIHFVQKKDKDYYSQVLLKEHEYTDK